MGHLDKETKLPKFIIIFSFFVWIFTEVLSIFHAVTSNNIRLMWTVLFIICLGILVIALKRSEVNIGRIFSYFRKSLLKMLRGQWSEIILIGVCFVLGAGMFYLAYIIVPNNWDSMTYHLARVANWIENASVEYYPTNISRQLYYSAFTEYFVLHICLFFKDDQMVNLVQWCSYVCSAIMIYRIALCLKVKKAGALFSALLFMLCPLAIAESVTTQTDLMATMWVIIFAYFVLLIGISDKSLLSHENIYNIIFCACSIGFGWLTKSSVCFIMPIMLLWLFTVCLKRKEKGTAMLRSTILALIIIVVLALPGFIRNYRSTGNIFAFEQMAGNLLIKTVNPKLLLLNTCKNITLEVAGTKEPDPMWSITMKLADNMRIDIENPEISAYKGFAEGRSCVKSYHHDTAGAQILLLVTGIAILIAVIKITYYYFVLKKKKTLYVLEETYTWMLLCAGGIMFICIRWQPWGNRLLFPALALFCIFAGYKISTAFSNKYVSMFLILISLLALLPDAYNSIKKQAKDYARSVWAGEERFDGYFKNRNECLDMYKEIINHEVVAEASKIGLLLGGDTYEYPLWIALKKSDVTIHHVLPEDNTVIWYPECIISIDNREIEKDSVMKYGDREYQCIWNFNENNSYSILVLKP